jgi:membrane-associated PAP2 superfamily phosphatase
VSAVRAPKDADTLPLRIAAAALVALLLWDASGLDLVVSGWFADAHGFAWRDAWWSRRLLHDDGRWLSAVLLVGGLLHAWWPRADAPGTPTRAERVGATVAVLASLILVPALKRASATSCPWDLAAFGGVASHVSHWRFGVADGGPGHCFPSGHAVAAFEFFGFAMLWRRRRPGVARAWLAVTLVAGTVFGFAQLARGAHYVSHTLWAAWLCGAIAIASQPQGAAATTARRLLERVSRAGRRVRRVRRAAAARRRAPGAAFPRHAPVAARPRRRAAGR